MQAIIVKNNPQIPECVFCLNGDLAIGNFDCFSLLTTIITKHFHFSKNSKKSKIAFCLKPHDDVVDGYIHTIPDTLPQDPIAIWNFLQNKEYQVYDSNDLFQYMKYLGANYDVMTKLCKWIRPIPSQVVHVWKTFDEMNLRPNILCDLSEVPRIVENTDLFMDVGEPSVIIPLTMKYPDFLPDGIWHYLNHESIKIDGKMPFIASFMKRDFFRDLTSVTIGIPSDYHSHENIRKPLFIFLEKSGYIIFERNKVLEAVSTDEKLINCIITSKNLSDMKHFITINMDQTITITAYTNELSSFTRGVAYHAYQKTDEIYSIKRLPKEEDCSFRNEEKKHKEEDEEEDDDDSSNNNSESDDDDDFAKWFPIMVPKKMSASFIKFYILNEYTRLALYENK